MPTNKQLEQVLERWSHQAEITNNSKWFKELSTGSLKISHYMGYLLETYHHAGLNPQIQAFCTMFFKNNPRNLIKLFFKHASSEIAHDILALNDLVKLGVDRERVTASKPQPSTVALNAYVLYNIQFVNPYSYLGYLIHLEYMPTRNGNAYMEMLRKIGVSDSALTFLEEHSTVDLEHNALMEKYFDMNNFSDKDVDDISTVAVGTCILHQKMIEDAFVNGEMLFKSAI